MLEADRLIFFPVHCALCIVHCGPQRKSPFSRGGRGQQVDGDLALMMQDAVEEVPVWRLGPSGSSPALAVRKNQLRVSMVPETLLGEPVDELA